MTVRIGVGGRMLAGLLLAVLTAAACGGGSSSSSSSSKKFVIGVSNTLTGNGWREEMICSIKAQAKASGVVSRVVVANRNGGPPEQIADIRSLISSGANAIIVNPADRDALDPVIKEAAQKGVTVVAVDQAVSAPEAYQLSNDQVKYGQLGAEWLFKQLNGQGNVIEMRGIDGAAADSDRHQGFMTAVAKYPGIHVVKSTFTNWSLDPAAQQMKDILNSGIKVDGIWTSGIDATIVDTYQTANKPFVPTVGADNNKFIQDLVNFKSRGLVGVAVTNPPPVGGAGVAIALDALQGKKPAHQIKLTPETWDNTTSQGLAKLQQVADPKLDPYYSVQYQVKPYTTYTKDQLTSCQGPS
jgi:ribose transport system substrate-binding protein